MPRAYTDERKIMIKGLKRFTKWIVHTQIWNSIFRQGWPDTERNRILTTLNTLIFHLHPIKVKSHALKVKYVFCLGGVSFFLFIVETITGVLDRKSTRLNSSHGSISYAVFCLKKKTQLTIISAFKTSSLDDVPITLF